MNQPPGDKQDDSRNIRIGARVVVELLRLQAQDAAPEKIKLVPVRSRNAMAVLRDKLVLAQQLQSSSGMQSSVAAALLERCRDLQIPLPVAQPDWGAILLLDQLFDQLLQNTQLDEQASRWLASLRLPVARYALLDYSFFFAPQNLARRFLNQAHLNLLSSSQKSRQILRESLQQFIQRILQDFKQDISVFNSICIEAQTWFAGQADRVGQIEEQLRSQESGRRKERVAEPRVVQELNRVAAGKQLPTMVLDFLHGEWRKSLRLVSMREGEDGSTWKRQIRITESIVEFALGCDDEKGREKHRSFYPVMMKNIKSLLVSVNEDPAALETAIDPLELILIALLNGASTDRVTVPPLQQTDAHITSVEVKQVSPRALQEIEALQLGDWVRIKTVDGSHELCRLTIKSADGEPWVLVSQSGKTVSKKTAFQLAQGLEGGVLDVIGQGHWWDEHLDQQLLQLHGRWQTILATQPKLEPSATKEPSAAKEPSAVKEPTPKLKPSAIPKSLAKPAQPPEPPAQSAPPAPAASDLTLVPIEQQAATAHSPVTVAPSRTDTILQNSQLTLEQQVPATGQDANARLQPTHNKPAPDAEPATGQADAEDSSSDTEDFLAPRPLTEEERAAALHAIDQVQVGGWILQQTSKGEERCKLAVKIRGRDKLVFVNRLGVKILEIDRLPLAELLARGLISIIDTGSKFDNTLERVVRGIQEERKSP